MRATVFLETDDVWLPSFDTPNDDRTTLHKRAGGGSQPTPVRRELHSPDRWETLRGGALSILLLCVRE